MLVCGLALVQINGRVYGERLQLMSPNAFGLSSHAGRHFVGVDTLGDSAGKQTILLIGNSHALTMKRYLDLFGRREGYEVLTISINSYPNLPGIPSETIEDQSLRTMHQRVMESTLALLPEVDVVLLSTTWDAGDWSEYVEKLHAMMRPNQALVVLRQYAVASCNPLRVYWDVVKHRDVDVSIAEVRPPLGEGVQALARREKNVAVVDLWRNRDFPDWPFCNDTLMYYDEGHLNVYGSEKYFEESGHRLAEVLHEVQDAMGQ